MPGIQGDHHIEQKMQSLDRCPGTAFSRKISTRKNEHRFDKLRIRRESFSMRAFFVKNMDERYNRYKDAKGRHI